MLLCHNVTLAVNRGIFLGAPRPVEGHLRHWPPWPSIISYPGLLYVHVSCFVVCGCGVSRRYIDVCYCDMFSIVNVYLDHLKFCVVCINSQMYVCCSECNVVDHGVLLHKMNMLGITGKLGVWLYHFLTGRTQFVRLQVGVSFGSPMISGVPHGTVLVPLLFIILMCDIKSGITSSSMVSFADDTRLYYGISNVDDCAILQNDLNSVYEWASDNNMFFNAQKFQYICFNPHI